MSVVLCGTPKSTADTVTGDDPMDEGIAGPDEPLEGGSALEALETPGKEKENKATLNFDNSNNDAEYEALLVGLRITAEMKVEKVHAFVDSKLVANQVEGSYEARGEKQKEGHGDHPVHDGPRKVIHKAMNAGYYWSSMQKDTNHEIRSCDSCQGMDIVGPLPKAPGRLKFLIVAVDYFTKWLEAKPVVSITGRQVKNFAFDNIVCRFRLSAVVITDNEMQLINEPFKSWAENLRIKLISTLVYHPQANGAVERANRIIMQGIQTRLHQEGAGWVEELPNVLWVHMTMPKTSNGETLFSLVYGTEAVIPAEVGMPTRRITQGLDESNEE
ncbi:reverse transcriptase domain-containing protein [Tanacetum coccineum]|uniref:Reverse transcriptase domain-containing protein n=1 Tax=Tanacetum coccineum TaxID=301880 RepID=A0ABQ5DIU1_9ASTR